MRTESNMLDTYAADSDIVMGWNTLQASFPRCADDMQLLNVVLVLIT